MMQLIYPEKKTITAKEIIRWAIDILETEVTQIADWFGSLADNAEGIFEQSAIAVQEKTGFDINLVKAAMIGAGGYIVLRKMHLGQLESILIAGTVAYFLSKK